MLAVCCWSHYFPATKFINVPIMIACCRDGDGFVTAEDLRMKLGSQEDVGQLIAAADKNGDGKIDYAEFCELLRNS